MQALSIVVWILSALFAAMMLMAGTMKLVRAQGQLPQETLQRVSAGTVKLIGAAEVLGAIGLILPPLLGILPWIAVAAALGLALIQVLAISAHRRLGEPFHANIVLAIVALLIGAGWVMVL